jgi:ABC-type transporter Mla subunit MlaD
VVTDMNDRSRELIQRANEVLSQPRTAADQGDDAMLKWQRLRSQSVDPQDAVRDAFARNRRAAEELDRMIAEQPPQRTAMDANAQKQWDRFVERHIEIALQAFRHEIVNAVGKVIAKERQARRDELKQALAQTDESTVVDVRGLFDRTRGAA